MEAASIGDTSILEYLLSKGVHVDIQAEDGCTALHCAAKTGSIATISFLLDNGAMVDLCNSKIQGRRPIHEAVLENRTEAFALLLYKGADLLLSDAKGQTVVDYIGQAGDTKIAQTLFCGEQKQICPLDMAKILAKSCVKSGNCSVLKWLLARFPSAISPSTKVVESPIYVATKRGHDAIVALILSWSQIPSHSTRSFVKAVSCSFMWAASREFAMLAKILLECNTIDPNQTDKETGLSPLQHAVVRGDLPMVEVLLHHQKIEVDSVDRSGQTPLHLAALQGHSQIIEMLVSHHNISVNSVDRSGRTPLHYAAHEGHSQMVGMLLGHHNIRVNIESLYGNEGTSLHVAVETGHMEIIKLLLAHMDIDTRCRDRRGQTPLEKTFFTYKWSAVQLIAKNHGLTLDIETKSTEGRMPTTNTDQYRLLTCLLLGYGLLHIGSQVWHDLIKDGIQSSNLEVIKLP
jgi:ankyrin repeat protein